MGVAPLLRTSALALAATIAAVLLLRRRRGQHAALGERESTSEQPTPVTSVEHCCVRKCTALHGAARHGNLTEVRAILSSAQVEVNALSDDGQTALHIASARQPPLVKLRAAASSPQLPSSALVALLL